MKIVIALGGNALGKTPEEQLSLVKKTAKSIVSIIKDGNDVIITHGNGPQVGMINLASEYAASNNITPSFPFPECNAMSEGYIGYQLGQAIINELKKENIDKECVTVVTQVLVNKNDSSFNEPTKPIGDFYTKEESEKLAKEKGYTFVLDAGRGYRRVVSSPKPIDIVEKETIKELVDNGTVVIACGGGGVPVIKENGKYKGVDAVIDKDKTSALLASYLGADVLLILTAVDKVCLNYGKENEIKLDELTIKDIDKYIKNNEFAKGSMLPKIEASKMFTKETGNVSIITSLLSAEDALKGKNGTLIKKELKEEKMDKKKKKKSNKKFMLSAFTIIFILIILLGLVTYLLPNAEFTGDTIVNGSGVIRAKLSDILLAPILGFQDAADVGIFIIVLGGFLKVVDKTNALTTGIQVLVKKLKGKELLLIPILMFIFSIGGTTYGMLEETVAFYALLAATMVAAGMDTIVASAIVLLGAGSGVLGSTINPFATGAAISALPAGITVNQGGIIALGVCLWLVSLLISMFFVLRYAKKVKEDKGSTFLSLREQKEVEAKFGSDSDPEVLKQIKKAKLTKKQKLTLILFGLTFVIMIIGFIPWGEFNVTIFDNFTSFLTGESFGNWWFFDAAVLFFVMSIVIALINGMNEKEYVETFIVGTSDILSVVLVIAVARGASILMQTTHLDNYIIYNAAEVLKGMPAFVYAPLNYILHVFLSVLVPSSSGLATLSTPIMGPLTHTLGYSVEVNTMIFVSANGLVNLITPTCGAIMGGLALAKVEYSTWFKWAFKIVLTIGLASIAILTLAMVIF